MPAGARSSVAGHPCRIEATAAPDQPNGGHGARIEGIADNGSPWYVSGMSDPGFDDDALHELDRFTGADVEVVDTSGLVNGL
jgi:hypothetical protein